MLDTKKMINNVGELIDYLATVQGTDAGSVTPYNIKLVKPVEVLTSAVDIEHADGKMQKTYFMAIAS